MSTKPLTVQQKRLVVLGLVSLVLWVSPYTRPLLYPLIYLNTHIHEFCHALAAWLTGGTPARIEVYASGSGITPIFGGNLLAVASAGYVGATVVGGALLVASRDAKHAQRALMALGLTLAFALLVLVRADLVGVLSALIWSILLIVVAKKSTPEWQQGLVAFLGIQQCLTASYSLLILQRLTVSLETQNDAGLLQDATGIPALFWAVIWSLMGLAAMWIGLKKSAA